MQELLAAIDETGRAFVQFATPMLWQSSLLILVVFGLDRLLRHRVRATVRYGLWMLVPLKLVLPTSLASPLSPAYWIDRPVTAVRTESPAMAARERPEAVTRTADRRSESRPLGRLTPAATAELPAIPPPLPARSPSIDVADVSLPGVIFLIWVGGAAGLAGVLLRRARVARRMVRRARAAGPELEAVLTTCRSLLPVNSRVSLRISADVPTPAVCGFLRPTILLPEELLPKLNPDQLKTVLVHELAHIVRGDAWVNALQSLLQIAYFYNPLVWFANRAVREIREQAVDETVLVTLGEGLRDDYVDTLLDVARLSCERPVVSTSFLGVIESRGTLRERIKIMLSRSVPKSATIGGVGLLTLALAGSALLPMASGATTALSPQIENQDPSADDERVRELKQRMRDLERELENLSRELRRLERGQPEGERGARADDRNRRREERARRRERAEREERRAERAERRAERAERRERRERRPHRAPKGEWRHLFSLPEVPPLPPVPELPQLDLSEPLSGLGEMLPMVIREAHELKALKEQKDDLQRELRQAERQLDRARENDATESEIGRAEDRVAGLRQQLHEAERRLEDRAAEFEHEMEDWGERYGRHMEEWAERFEKEQEHLWERWGNDYSQQWERWGDEYGRQWEAWAERFEKQMEEFEKQMEKWGEEQERREKPRDRQAR